MKQQHDQQVAVNEEEAPIFGIIRSFLTTLLQKIFPSEQEAQVDHHTCQLILSEFEKQRTHCFSIAQGAIEAFSKNEELLKNKRAIFEGRVERMASQTTETALCYASNFDMAFKSETGSKRAISFRERAFRVTDELGKRLEVVSSRVRSRLEQEHNAEFQKQSRYLVARLKELEKEDIPRIKKELTAFVRGALQGAPAA